MVAFTPLSSVAESEMETWILQRILFRKADSLISVARSRIARAERLRTDVGLSTTGMKAAVLSRAAKDESLGRGNMALVPAYRERLREMLVETRVRLNGALLNG